MNLEELCPVILYDDKCYLCSKFAIIVNFFSRNSITFIGHSTKLGEQIRENYLDYNALEMFWLINNKTAFGGRAALIPLIIHILSHTKNKKIQQSIDSEMCGDKCNGLNSVFLRSASLLLNSKKIKIQ